MLIKPQIDTRYSTTMIHTHDNLQRKCIVRRNLIPLFENSDYQQSEHIIIEEAQFFDDLEPFVVKSLCPDVSWPLEIKCVRKRRTCKP